MKCPDCKVKLAVERNGDWRCGYCDATGTVLEAKPVVVSRHVTYSGQMHRTKKGKTVTQYFGTYVLNDHHPGSSLMTRLRAAIT